MRHEISLTEMLAFLFWTQMQLGQTLKIPDKGNVQLTETAPAVERSGDGAAAAGASEGTNGESAEPMTSNGSAPTISACTSGWSQG